MSNAKQETIADIVADIRAQNQGLPEDSYALSPLVCDLLSFADRIEAAWKQFNRLGNAAKMREALRGLLEIVCIDCNSSYKVDGKCVKCPRVVAAESALAAPPRKCDVGTADEQAERFAEYCDSEACKRNRCKSRAKALYIERCAIAWAQMPYEEGCAK